MYQSPTRRNFRTGLLVGALHVGIAAALLTTFAGGVINQVIHHPLQAQSWAYVPPPPPQPSPVTHARAQTHDTVVATQSPIPGLTHPSELELTPMTPLPSFGGNGEGYLPDIPPVTQATPTFAPIAARPLGDRGAWITTDDYPSRALREGWSGVSRLHLLIGSDGRVAGCSVTASSGHPELDSVACAKVTERARFSPAHDGSGAVGAGTYDGAIRWRINEAPGD